MSLDLGSGGATVLVAILSIWGLVALVLFIWYLWALSKLFPYLGLPARDGWIPVWNQWRLIGRAGLPGGSCCSASCRDSCSSWWS